MKIDPAYKVRKIANTNLVICQGKTGGEMTRVISLNSTALELWNVFEGKEFSYDDIAAYLVEKYQIDRELAVTDASGWIDMLKQCNVIVE